MATIEFKEEQGKELTNYVEQQALARIKEGVLLSEADFYSGAAYVIQYLLGKDSRQLTRIVPPMWIIGIMAGRSPSTRWEENEETKAQHDTKLERQFRLYSNAELMYELATDLHECKDRDQYEEGYAHSTPSQILNRMMTHARLVLEDIGLYDFWKEEDE